MPVAQTPTLVQQIKDFLLTFLPYNRNLNILHLPLVGGEDGDGLEEGEEKVLHVNPKFFSSCQMSFCFYYFMSVENVADTNGK